jgi:hypothetical protein
MPAELLPQAGVFYNSLTPCGSNTKMLRCIQAGLGNPRQFTELSKNIFDKAGNG